MIILVNYGCGRVCGGNDGIVLVLMIPQSVNLVFLISVALSFPPIVYFKTRIFGVSTTTKIWP